MDMKRYWIALLLFFASAPLFAQDPGLHVVNTFKLGGEGGWDYLTLDPSSRHLFISRGTHVIVIDADSGKVLGDISDTLGVHGMALDPKDLKVKARWPLAPCEEPSGLAMDIKNRRLFAGCDNKMMAVVNADTGKVITTLPIGQGVDANRFDPDTQLAFASCGEGVLTVVHEDAPDKFSVVQSVATQRGARTMTFDPKTHQIYLVIAKLGPPPVATAV